MSSITKKTQQGVQPLAADDANLADLSSDEELSGASEGDGPLHHAEEAKDSTTISGDGPEILRDTDSTAYAYLVARKKFDPADLSEGR